MDGANKRSDGGRNRSGGMNLKCCSGNINGGVGNGSSKVSTTVPFKTIQILKITAHINANPLIY